MSGDTSSYLYRLEVDMRDHASERCSDPWCAAHAACGVCQTRVIILDDDDPAFCPGCGHDVMPKGACTWAAKQVRP